MVITPILNTRSIGIAQNIIVSDQGVGNCVVRKLQNELPKLCVEILERNGAFGPAASKNFVVARDEKRLANLGVKA